MIEIDERLKIHEDEEELDYAMRLIEMKKNGDYDLDWSDIVELLKLDCHHDSLRKSQDTKFGGYSVYKEMKKRNLKSLNVDYGKEINEKIEELKKERIKISDERMALNKKLREEARFEVLQDIIHKVGENMKQEYPIKLDILKNDKVNQDKVAVLLLSDIHYGMETNIINNVYNIDVFTSRFEKLLERTSNFIKENNVSKIYVLGLGDFVNGIIHIGTRLENKENIVSQIMHFSESLSKFLIHLSETVEVEYHHVVGNHGRIFDKDSCGNDDNFELLIKEYVESRTKGYNVFIKNSFSSELGVVEILGNKYVYTHGHREGLKNIVNKITNILNINPIAVFLGHTHSPQMYYEANTYVCINGCMCGDSQYSENLRLSGKPSQSLFLLTNEGIKYQYIVEL